MSRRSAPSRRLTELELSAWQSLLHAHDIVLKRLDQELRARHEINLSDYDVLVRLARADGRKLNMTELAQRVMMSPSGLTRAIDRLVDRGLINRTRETADNRVVHAVLTDAGLARARQAARTHIDGIRRHFIERLSPEQVQQVAGALGQISGPHVPH